MKYLILALLFLFLGLPTGVAAQQHQDITFVANVSKQRMLKNTTLEYSLVLRNAEGSQLQPPAFEDFIVLQGPGRTFNTTIVNGVATSSTSFTWLLQPKRTGQLTIEPATIRAANRTYRANSKTVVVLEVNEELAATAPENFLRVEVSTDRAFVGQQIIMDLNLYTTVNPTSRNMVREPDLDGFFARVRRRFDASPVSLLENGREYQRRTLASLALYPIKSGRLTIDPYRMVIGAIRFRNANSSFSRRYIEQIPVNSDTVYVEVSELPQPRPADFSGGVGTYRVEVQADRNEMSTDDALTLTMRVTGQGDIQRLEAPTPVDKREWDIYDPRVIEEEFLDSPSGMFGRKTFQYQLIPKRGGSYTLRPTLTYFNTDSASYISDTPLDLEITVTGGTGQKTYTVDTSAVVEEILTLRSARPLRPGRRYDKNLGGQPFFWGLFLLPLLLGGGLLGYQRYRDYQAAQDPAISIRAAASKVATKRLKQAKIYLEQEDARAFYNEVEGAVLSYLRDRFNLGAADLGRKQISTILREAGGENELIESYDQLLQRCEMALYAGQRSIADLQQTYASALELITDTERQLK